jgi:pimeloyl-ACP methyl ester carboxylesterase
MITFEGMKLFFRHSGQGQPLIILHGLFGSSDNWYSLAKVFASQFEVFALDQRNHGLSPHSPDLDYRVLTEDLKDFITGHRINRPIVMGHSMGGKTTMNLAVRYPDLVSSIIIVDIVPKAYPVHHDHILEGLKALPLTTLGSRSEADEILAQYVPEPGVRQFLLKSLSRKDHGGFEWRINLRAIEQNIEALGAGMVYPGTYDGPALFIRGSRSDYYEDGDESFIKTKFPNAKFSVMETGHWVQAEKPEEFSKLVLGYLAE